MGQRHVVRGRQKRGTLRFALALVAGLVIISSGASRAPGLATNTHAVSRGANVWVDANGGACTRQANRAAYSDAKACGSLQSAANAARSGDLVLIRPGRYAGQQLTGTKRLTLAGLAGRRPAFGQIIISAANVVFRHVLIENRDPPTGQTVCSYFDFTLFACGPNEVFDDVVVDGLSKGSGNPERRGGLQVDASATNFVFKNGEIENVADHKGFQGGADGMLIDNNTFHDIRLTPAGGAVGVHNECAYVTGGDHQTWRRNRFLRCPVMAMFFPNYIGGPPFSNVTIENNLFTHTLNDDGSWHDGAAFVIPNGASGQNQVNNWVVRFNTFEVPPDFGSTPGTGDDNGSARFYGNLGSDGACRAREWTYRYNVGHVCGGTGEISVNGATNDSTHPNQAPFYVNAPAGNFQLRRGSAAINRGDPDAFPPTDETRRPRLIGSAPDAGAYEFRGGSATTGIVALPGSSAHHLSRAVKAFKRQNPASLTLALGSVSRHSIRRLRSVQVIALGPHPATPAETKWLKRTLARKSPLVRIVLAPTALCGTPASTPARSLIQRYGVRLVINAASAGVRTCAGSQPTRKLARDTRGFVYVTVDVGGVVVRVVDVSGKTVDRVRLD